MDDEWFIQNKIVLPLAAYPSEMQKHPKILILSLPVIHGCYIRESRGQVSVYLFTNTLIRVVSEYEDTLKREERRSYQQYLDEIIMENLKALVELNLDWSDLNSWITFLGRINLSKAVLQGIPDKIPTNIMLNPKIIQIFLDHVNNINEIDPFVERLCEYYYNSGVFIEEFYFPKGDGNTVGWNFLQWIESKVKSPKSCFMRIGTKRGW
jgi:hypothetical protein